MQRGTCYPITKNRAAFEAQMVGVGGGRWCDKPTNEVGLVKSEPSRIFGLDPNSRDLLIHPTRRG